MTIIVSLFAGLMMHMAGCGRNEDGRSMPPSSDWNPQEPLQIVFNDMGVPHNWDSLVVKTLETVYTDADEEGNFLLAIRGNVLLIWDCATEHASSVTLEGRGPLTLLSGGDGLGIYRTGEGYVWMVDLADGTCSRLPVDSVANAWPRVAASTLSMLTMRYADKSGSRPLLQLAQFRRGQLLSESDPLAFFSVHDKVMWDMKGEHVAWIGTDWETWRRADFGASDQLPGANIWTWTVGREQPEQFRAPHDRSFWYVDWLPGGKMLFEKHHVVEATHELISELYRQDRDAPLVIIHNGHPEHVRLAPSGNNVAFDLTDEHFERRVAVVDCKNDHVMALSPADATYGLIGWTCESKLAVCHWLAEEYQHPQVEILDIPGIAKGAEEFRGPDI